MAAEEGQISNTGTSRQAGDLIQPGTLRLLPPLIHSKVLQAVASQQTSYNREMHFRTQT
jgi:hypothetical protein